MAFSSRVSSGTLTPRQLVASQRAHALQHIYLFMHRDFGGISGAFRLVKGGCLTARLPGPWLRRPRTPLTPRKWPGDADTIIFHISPKKYF